MPNDNHQAIQELLERRLKEAETRLRPIAQKIMWPDGDPFEVGTSPGKGGLINLPEVTLGIPTNKPCIGA